MSYRGGNEMNYRDVEVDLHKQILLQITELGIPTANIQASEICTFESDKCYSYRRDGSDAGRMYAYMGMK